MITELPSPLVGRYATSQASVCDCVVGYDAENSKERGAVAQLAKALRQTNDIIYLTAHPGDQKLVAAMVELGYEISQADASSVTFLWRRPTSHSPVEGDLRPPGTPAVAPERGSALRREQA